jgi:hypothetical protein
LDVQRRSVIYLYREPVATTYSQLHYYQEDTDDLARIWYWADLYGRHLDKWLHSETFTTHKTLVTYEGMQSDLAGEFAKVVAHFGRSFDAERFAAVAARVTREEVKRKTPHDEQVVQLDPHYRDAREIFHAKHAQYVWDVLLKDREHLQSFFGDNPA